MQTTQITFSAGLATALIALGAFATGCGDGADTTASTEAGLVQSGTYQASGDQPFPAADGSTVTAHFRYQLDLRADATFFGQAFVTSPDLGWTDKLVFEYRGAYVQQGEALHYTTAEQHGLDMTGSLGDWQPLDGGTFDAPLRSVTRTSFDAYDSQNMIWHMFVKAM